jgi:sulfate adenylyltransferase
MLLAGSMYRRSNIEPGNDIALRPNHGPYAAHEILKESSDLGIEPMLFKKLYYSKECVGIANEKICPRDSVDRPSFSGTKLRGIFLSGQRPPLEIVRPEVSEVVSRWHGPFVE